MRDSDQSEKIIKLQSQDQEIKAIGEKQIAKVRTNK